MGYLLARGPHERRVIVDSTRRPIIVWSVSLCKRCEDLSLRTFRRLVRSVYWPSAILPAFTLRMRGPRKDETTNQPRVQTLVHLANANFD